MDRAEQTAIQLVPAALRFRLLLRLNVGANAPRDAALIPVRRVAPPRQALLDLINHILEIGKGVGLLILFDRAHR